MKGTVFQVRGTVPANNYIMLPKSSSQSLSITDSFFYLLFCPLPAKYFVVHLEVVTTNSMVMRISFSNMFKEFKSTSTWLQVPYRHGVAEIDGMSNSSSTHRSKCCWTFLVLNLKEILFKYLSSMYSYLKNVKLCSNILVKNVFSSDIEYSPLEQGGFGGGGYFQLPPKEMRLPLSNGVEFLDVYDYVCFPGDGRRIQREQSGMMGPSENKLLKKMKPEKVLVSSSDLGYGISKHSGNSKVIQGLSNWNQAKRCGNHKMSKPGQSLADKEVGYFVKRVVGNFGRGPSSNGFGGTSRCWQMAEHGDNGCGESGSCGKRRERSGVSSTGRQNGAAVVEEEERDGHIFMGGVTEGALTKENCLRREKIVVMKKERITVSEKNSDW